MDRIGKTPDGPAGNTEKSVNQIIAFDLNFPKEYLKAALVFSFLSVSVLAGIFYYLNRFTKRRYFSFWTVGWLLHALWLGLCIEFPDVVERPALIMVKQWCVGASAAFLLWALRGSAESVSSNPIKHVLDDGRQHRRLGKEGRM